MNLATAIDIAPSARPRSLIAAALLVATSLMLACGGGQDSTVTPGPILGGPADPAVCGSADLSVLASVIYVSPQGTDGDTCGRATSSACKTVQQGIANCSASGCGVLLRWGRYATGDAAAPLPDHVVLREAVSVYGSCRFDGEVDRKYRSVVQGPPDGRPVITADGIGRATTLQGVMVLANNARTAGAPSIAMSVTGSTGLSLRSTRLVSAMGADAPSPALAADAGGGEAGQDGVAPGGTRAVAAAGGRACPSQNPSNPTGHGGNGGISFITLSNAGVFYVNCDILVSFAGSAGTTAGSAPGGGGAGGGQNGGVCWTNVEHVNQPTTAGSPGAVGSVGDRSLQGGTVAANPFGSFSGSTWIGSTAGTGQPGNWGSGGGGGGPSGFAAVKLGDNFYALQGGRGGGGGGGGCGGTAGPGGAQGGASIGLLLVNSKVSRDPSLNSVIASAGGRGGAGGTGGEGGPGGPGGFGQPGGGDYANSGGDGAVGGPGGPGSGGVGGAGGPSLGIALIGNSSVDGMANAAGGNGAAEAWTPCATEGGVCTMSGAHAVRYGTEAVNVVRDFVDSAPCDVATFGDPVPFTHKQCWYSNNPVLTGVYSGTPGDGGAPGPGGTSRYTPAQSQWAACAAAEGQTCSFSGTRAVRYGVGPGYTVRTFTGSVLCSYTVFGVDPAPGRFKACFVSTVPEAPLPHAADGTVAGVKGSSTALYRY